MDFYFWKPKKTDFFISSIKTYIFFNIRYVLGKTFCNNLQYDWLITLHTINRNQVNPGDSDYRSRLIKNLIFLNKEMQWSKLSQHGFHQEQ